MNDGMRLLSYVVRRKKLAIVTVILSSTGSLLGMAMPILAREAINQLVLQNIGNIWQYALGIVALFVLQGMLSYAQRYYSGLLSEYIVFDLRNDVYSHMQSLSYSFFARTDAGQIIARATSDVEGIKHFIRFAVGGFMGALLTFLFALTIMMYLNAELTLIVLSIFPIVFLLTRFFAKRVREHFRRAREVYSGFTSWVRESIIGIKVLKSYTAEEMFTGKFEDMNADYWATMLRIARLRASVWPFFGFLVSLVLLGIYWYGGLKVISGSVTIGDVVAFSIYVGMITWPMIAIGFFTVSFERALVSARRVFEILDAEPDVKDAPDAMDFKIERGEIALEDVWFRYDKNENWILSGVNLRIRPGEKVAIVGATGSGKTTLAQLIPRFFDPTRGRILIDGVDVRKIKLDSLRRQIGIVHQDIYLFPDTFRNNIAYGKLDVAMEEVVRAAKMAMIHDFIESLPKGYDTIVGERGVTLSGGQRQRLAIARTLIVDPKIIILDDSTSSIDYETERAIYRALSDYFKDKTVIIISHRPTTLRLADRVVVLESGRIVREGRFEDLIAKDRVFARIFKGIIEEAAKGG